MSKKLNKYDEFINEELLGFDSFKSLLDKIKAFMPKSKIQEFIKNNKEEVERVQKLLEDDKGNIDQKKAFDFVRTMVKK